ncbi:MAG: GxxExxY protein [Termitinemataceae bacterium]|nr:MAG: GxxExxY protein [Termitinemataceae bacterium]
MKEFVNLIQVCYRVIILAMITITNEDNKLTEAILGCAYNVHSALGPGLLEKTYQACLAYELQKNGFVIQLEKSIPVIYGDVTIDAGFRLDMLVENRVIIENKSIAKLLPIHSAQLMTYLRLSNISIGLLINWNTLHLKDGIKRIAM